MEESCNESFNIGSDKFCTVSGVKKTQHKSTIDELKIVLVHTVIKRFLIKISEYFRYNIKYTTVYIE